MPAKHSVYSRNKINTIRLTLIHQNYQNCNLTFKYRLKPISNSHLHLFPHHPLCSCCQVCTDVLEKMRSAKGTDARLNLLTPIWKRVGRQSTFPFLRLLLPQVRSSAGASKTPLLAMHAHTSRLRAILTCLPRLYAATFIAYPVIPVHRWRRKMGKRPLTLKVAVVTVMGTR